MSYENKYYKIIRKPVLILTLLLITCVQLPIKPRMIEHKKIIGDVVAFSTINMYPILIDKNNVIICTDYTATEVLDKVELPGTIVKYIFYENWSKEFNSFLYATYSLNNEYHLTCINCFKSSEDSTIVFDIVIGDQQLSSICTNQKSEILAVTQSINKKELFLYDINGHLYSKVCFKKPMLLASYRTINNNDIDVDMLYGFDGQCLSLFSVINNIVTVTIKLDTKELSTINNSKIGDMKLTYPYLNYTDKYIITDNGKTIFLINCLDFNITAQFPNYQYSMFIFNRLLLNNKGLYLLRILNNRFIVEQVLSGDFDVICYYYNSSVILKNKVNNLYYHFIQDRYYDVDKITIDVYDFSTIKDIDIVLIFGLNKAIYSQNKTYIFNFNDY